jgi:hypothetical protein
MIIKDKKKLEELYKRYNYFYISSERRDIFGLLYQLYSTLPLQTRNAWQLYARYRNCPRWKYRGSDAGVRPGKLALRSIKARTGGQQYFVKLNLLGLIRKVIDKPQLLPYFGPSAITPPLLKAAEITSDSIILHWKDPNLRYHDSDYKDCKFYLTIYCAYTAKIDNKNVKKPSSILSVIPLPSSEKFELKHLILPKGYLIALAEVDRAVFSFQMDTLMVKPNYAPLISHLSNIEVVSWEAAWNKSEAENIVKKISNLINRR